MKSIYLVAYYYQKPKTTRVRTSRAGWMKDENNVAWDEQVAISRNLKTKDITTAKIILDLAKKQVVRNGWLNQRSFDDLFQYFQKGYPQYTTEIMNQIDPTYLNPQRVADQPVRVLDTSTTLSST